MLGCASFHFPPPVATPVPVEARRLRVLLATAQGASDRGAQGLADLGDGLEKALADAGFEVLRYGARSGARGHGSSDGHAPGAGKAYDFVVLYDATAGSDRGSGQTYAIMLALDGNDGARSAAAERSMGGDRYPFSWGARYAASKGETTEPDFPSQMDSCFASWRREASSGGPPGTLARASGDHGLGVNAPTWWDLDSVQESDLGTRAAYFLVNRLTSCPGFAAFAKSIKDTGLDAGAPLDKLATDSLMNLCQASAANEYVDIKEWQDHPGSQSRDFTFYDDACAVVLQRDRSLAARVGQIRAAASTLYKEKLHAELQEHTARLSAGGDEADSPGSPTSGTVVSGAGSSGIDPVTGKLLQQAAQGIVKDIEQAADHHGRPREERKEGEKKR